MDIDQEIRKIEEEIQNTPYNKATQHHIGKLKAKLARLREQRERGGGGASTGGFGVRKTGDATVGMVGFPSVGKSTLLNQLTNADSQIGEYDFTTTEVIPGVMEEGGCRIQILDLPGIIGGAAEGRGEGKKIISIARVVDLVLILVDAHHLSQVDFIQQELWRSGIRLNRRPPPVSIKKKGRGGITIELSRRARIDRETARLIAQEYLINADIVIRGEVDREQFIDALSDNRVYVPAVAAANKIDTCNTETVDRIRKQGLLPISAQTGAGLDDLRKLLLEKLELVRVYMKPEGKPPDRDRPLVVKKGARIEDVCRKLHRGFVKKFRYAQVWGPSAAFPGQRVGLQHQVMDGDTVTIVTRT
ncbi:MAG: OBG GTPase family GTP-binding protein [Thermoplasmatota archaeon]